MQSRSSTAGMPLVMVLVGVAIVAVVLVGFSEPAAAKGPESATVTGPGIDRTIELLDTADVDLVGQLMEQTGIWYVTGDHPSPLEEPTGELGPAYTVTWINSGPPGESVEERTIRQLIYLEAENGPVLHNPAQEGLEGWGPGVIGWFAAPNGLRDTLAELGVPISEASSFGEAPTSEMSAVTAPAKRQSEDTFWYLAVVSLALVVELAWSVWHRTYARHGYRHVTPSS